MTETAKQFAGGAPSGNGRSVEVCSNRLDLLPDAPRITIRDALRDDPGRPGLLPRRKSGDSRVSITPKCKPEILTPSQASEYLGVPETTLAQWRSQRKGPPYIKLESRLVRYRRSSLEEWLARQTVETEVDRTNA